MAEYGEWNRKGATLSDVTAEKEYGVTREFIVEGIRAGNVSYRVKVPIIKSKTQQYVSSHAMSSAKPLKVGGSPLKIETGSAERGRMIKRARRSVDREALQAARSLASSPKHDKPRKKVVEVDARGPLGNRRSYLNHHKKLDKSSTLGRFSP